MSSSSSLATVTTTSNEENQPNHFRKYFSNLVSELLDQLSYSFADCKCTQEMREAFNAHIKNNDKNEEKMITNWHTVMKPYYKILVQDPMTVFTELLDILTTSAEKLEDIRLADVIANMVMAKMTKNDHDYSKYQKYLYDPVYFLKQLKLRQKWRDPSFDDDSRRYIVCYMLHLNGFAIMHSIVPSNLLAACVDVEAKNEATAENFNPRNMLSQMPKEGINGLMQNMPLFMLAISFLSGTGLEGGNMLMTLLQSSGPLAEQLGPMKNVLNMVMPLLGNMSPDAFDNMSQFMENPVFQNLVNNVVGNSCCSSDNQGGFPGGNFPNMDPNLLQSMMKPEMLASMIQNIQGFAVPKNK